MRGRIFLPGLIALLIAALGLLGPDQPAHASVINAAAMPADCPMQNHQAPAHRPDGMPAGCPCCCAVAAALPQVASPSPPSVVRLPMTPIADLTGGPGRTIPPALGPPRPAV